MSYWWGNPRSLSPAMALEFAAIKRIFDPSVVHVIDPKTWWDKPFEIHTLQRRFIYDDPERPAWQITFTMEELEYPPPRWVTRIRKPITIQIQYHREHPYKEPWVTVLSHSVSGSPHLFRDMEVICLHAHDGPRTGWDPATSNAATFGLWAAQWLRAWLYWKENDRWPEN